MRRILFLIVLLTLVTPITSFAADNLKEMFKNGTIKGEIRYRDFARNYDDSSRDRADSAFGGLFYYKTDSLYGITLGSSFLTSTDLNSSDSKNVYGLLKKDENGNHDSYTKLGEFYVQGSWFDTTIKAGSQELHTPFANVYDFRMSPRLYKGVSILNKSVAGLELQAFYITKFMQLNDTEFIPISEAFKSSVDDDKPLIIASAKYTLPTSIIDKLTVQAWTYNMPDVYRLNYFRTDYKKKMNEILVCNFRLDYITQGDIGDGLAGEFDTDQYGFMTGFEAYGLRFDVAYSKTGDDNLSIPFGDSLIVAQAPGGAYRAEEDAYLARAMYNFAHVGAKGLVAYIDHAYYDTPDSGENASFDINETDFNVNYAFSGFMDGFSLRFRYAYINTDEDLGGVDHYDIRYYATYKFTFGGK